MQNSSLNTCEEKRAEEIKADFGRCFLNESKGKVCEGRKMDSVDPELRCASTTMNIRFP